MVTINCRMAARSTLLLLAGCLAEFRTVATRELQGRLFRLRSAARTLVLHQPASLQVLRDESVTAVYFAACRDHSVNGRRSPGWFRRVSPIAGFGAAPSRLPHHSGADVLSGRQPGRGGFSRHCTPGASIWSNPRSQPDDLHEFLRELHHYAAIYS